MRVQFVCIPRAKGHSLKLEGGDADERTPGKPKPQGSQMATKTKVGGHFACWL